MTQQQDPEAWTGTWYGVRSPTLRIDVPPYTTKQWCLTYRMVKGVESDESKKDEQEGEEENIVSVVCPIISVTFLNNQNKKSTTTTTTTSSSPTTGGGGGGEDSSPPSLGSLHSNAPVLTRLHNRDGSYENPVVAAVAATDDTTTTRSSEIPASLLESCNLMEVTATVPDISSDNPGQEKQNNSSSKSCSSVSMLGLGKQLGFVHGIHITFPAGRRLNQELRVGVHQELDFELARVKVQMFPLAANNEGGGNNNDSSSSSGHGTTTTPPSMATTSSTSSSSSARPVPKQAPNPVVTHPGTGAKILADPFCTEEDLLAPSPGVASAKRSFIFLKK